MKKIIDGPTAGSERRHILNYNETLGGTGFVKRGWNMSGGESARSGCAV